MRATCRLVLVGLMVMAAACSASPTIVPSPTSPSPHDARANGCDLEPSGFSTSRGVWRGFLSSPRLPKVTWARPARLRCESLEVRGRMPVNRACRVQICERRRCGHASRGWIRCAVWFDDLPYFPFDSGACVRAHRQTERRDRPCGNGSIRMGIWKEHGTAQRANSLRVASARASTYPGGPYGGPLDWTDGHQKLQRIMQQSCIAPGAFATSN